MTKTNTAAPQFGDLQDRTRALSPLLILAVGGTVKGVLQRVNRSADEDKQGKWRHYYELALIGPASGLDKDGKAFEAASGELVTIPGTGGLDFTMQGIVREVAGLKEDAEVKDWSPIKGYLFVITRNADEKMSKGKHKGKPVKVFGVQMAAPVGA